MSLAGMIAARIQPRARVGEVAASLPSEDLAVADRALLRACGAGWTVRRWAQGGGALASLSPPGTETAYLPPGPRLVPVDGIPIAVCAAGAPVLADVAGDARSAEALARGWMRWGIDLLPRLQGPFALALWNLRSAEVLLARDALGLQPLYATEPALAGAIDPDAIAPSPALAATSAAQEGAVAAASSIALLRALLRADALGEDAIDEAAIADLLLGVFPPPQRTAWRGIVSLEPGQWLRIDAQGRRSLGHWWRPRLRQARPSDARAPEPRALARAAEELRARLEAAVARALAHEQRAPIGLWLSGGLDSSAVGALVARALAARDGAELTTCSLAFPGMRGADESRYIAAFRQHFASRHASRDALGIDPLAHLRELVRACGQPMLIGNHAYAWTLAGLAHQQGCGAAFTGHDGDTTIGYRLMHLGDLAGANPPAALGTLCALSRTHGERRLSLLDQGIWTPWRARIRAALGRSGGLPALRSSAVADLLSRTGAWERARAQWAGMPERARGADEEHLREVGSAAFAHATTFLAHVGQAHGLSLHHPLADRAVVEFALALPANLAQARGWSRYVLRQAVADLLPRPLAWRRRKAHLSAPLYRALSANGRASVRALLHDAPPRLWQWCDRAHADALVARLEREPWRDLTDDGMLGLWHVLWLAAWLGGGR
jgi:asparagine synthase (glutamine-hydrolysing)